MAAMCTVPSVAAAAQHVVNYTISIRQVSLQNPCVPRNSQLPKLVSNAICEQVRDGMEYLVDDCHRSAPCILSTCAVVSHGSSSVGIRNRFDRSCVIAAAEFKVLKQDSSSAHVVNVKPIIASMNSPSEPNDDRVELKPAPRPASRPKLSPPASLEHLNTTGGTRSTPKPDGGGQGDAHSNVKQMYRFKDETINPREALGPSGQKAQTSSSAKQNRYSKSIWRKGDRGDSSSQRSPAEDASERVTLTNHSSQYERMKISNDAEANTSSSVSPTVSMQQPSRTDPRRPALKLTVKSPTREGPQSARSAQKQIILSDSGAFGKPLVPKSKSPATKSEAVANVAPAAAAQSKPGKTLSPKGKDGKEDWRKNLTTVDDGPKKKVGSKVEQADDEVDGDLPVTARQSGRKMTKASRRAARAEAAKASAPVKVDILEVGKQGLSVPDLAQKLAVNDAEIVKTLFMKGIVTTVNQTLDFDTVKLVCQEFEVEVLESGITKVEDLAKKTSEFLDAEDLDHLQVRPPIVTVMGHVDHGKTSLLDYIRKTKVAAGEAGGITQGIGAYAVPVTVDGEAQKCVFLDTPGHQAFSAMRARGARVTDIAVIVVAADDGVRPQTQEAIAHAKAANVPIVVAVNKIDKDGAEPERVMHELSSLGVLAEDWGGDVPMVQVSALKGVNVDMLLETVMLVAELQDLKANPDRSAKGTVIESCLDKTKGVVATLLVQNGTLRKGDVVLSGEAYGKVRALLDDIGERVDEAGPSTAVQVIGFGNVPVAGDEFEVLDSLEVARERAEQCGEDRRLMRLAAQAGEGKVTLSSVANSVSESQDRGVERHQLNIVLKVDVQGTLEAIREALIALPQDTVNLRLLMQAAGDVTASDVDLAIASEAIIIGFNVGVQSEVQAHADNKGVEIRLYRVIYELVDDIRNAMEGLLDPAQEEVPIGTAEVRAIFSSGSSKVAGCMVTDGKLVKGCTCKILRGSTVVHTGVLDSLRRVKEIAKEVIAGLECGIGVESFHEWQEGDILEAYNIVAKKRTLEEASVITASSLAALAENAVAPVAVVVKEA